MKILILLALLFISSLAGNNDYDDGKTGVRYTVTVVRAEDLPDEDMDTFFYTNKNDVYVQVFGYGNKGDDAIKEYSTRTIDGSDTPEWNEKFYFDEDDDDCGEYEKLLFKCYDEDVIGEDFLGETKYFELNKVDCDYEYAEEMTVYRDGNAGGRLFIVVEKDGCDSKYDDKDDDKYDTKEDDKYDSKEDDKYDDKDDDKYDDKDDDKYDDKDDKDDKEDKGGKNKRLLLL